MNPYKFIKIIFFLVIILMGLSSLSSQKTFSNPTKKVILIELNDDTINPVTAEYIIKAIDHAQQENAQCLIIKMDTPGGLLSSTRTIVKKMLTAKVPIVVYIAPSGSRAGSAGVFITYASHIAAMASSTNIGAAHPVKMDGSRTERHGDWQELKKLIEEIKAGKALNNDTQKDEKIEFSSDEIEPDENPMKSKILNDTVAFIKTIAKERGRNVEWGIQSVTKSYSVTEQEAIDKGIVEIIAKDVNDLLKQLNGRIVKISNKKIVLDTQDVVVETITMNPRQEFFNILANPNIAYFLMILGFYGLLFEVTHPGIGAPGILGAIFLILAFYSLATLPTNYAGVALTLIGLTLLIAEAVVPGFGLLTLGGVACLILGSMLLFDSVDPVMRVSNFLIFTLAGLTGGVSIFLVRSLIHSFRKKISTGQEGLIGMVGEARTDISPKKDGKIFVHGEIWNAESTCAIKKGSKVKVITIDGLTVTVEVI